MISFIIQTNRPSHHNSPYQLKNKVEAKFPQQIFEVNIQQQIFEEYPPPAGFKPLMLAKMGSSSNFFAVKQSISETTTI